MAQRSAGASGQVAGRECVGTVHESQPVANPLAPPPHEGICLHLTGVWAGSRLFLPIHAYSDLPGDTAFRLYGYSHVSLTHGSIASKLSLCTRANRARERRSGRSPPFPRAMWDWRTASGSRERRSGRRACASRLPARRAPRGLSATGYQVAIPQSPVSRAA